MDKKTGIWLDKNQAYIVSLENESHTLKIIESNAEFRVREDGEGKTYTRFGDQFGTKEKSKKAKLNQQLKDFYKTIISAVSDADELYIFGPAEAKNDLNKMILEHNHLAGKVKAIESEDKLTENQIVAAVKKYFNF